MTPAHKNLSAGRWNGLSFTEQMANIGSEVERTIGWKKKDNTRYSELAFERALELLDLTIADAKNRRRLRELTRVRECLADYFFFSNTYQSTAESWQRYFFCFTYAAQMSRNRVPEKNHQRIEE